MFGHSLSKFFSAFFVLFLLGYIAPAIARPDIAWSEPPHITLMAGTATSVNIQLESRRDLANIAVSVVPALASFVSVYPETFTTLVAGESKTISLWVSVPADTPLGTYDGTIHLKQGKRTLARPLPIVLDVTDLQAVAEPTELATPSRDRIVTDGASGVTLVKDEIMVTLAPSGSPDVAHFVADSLGGKVIGGFPELQRYQIYVPALSLADLGDFLAQARSIEGVLAANGHYFATTDSPPRDGTFLAYPLEYPLEYPAGPKLDLTTPIACDFVNWTENTPAGCNWGHEFVQLPSAWNITQGNTSAQVTVIDTGFYVDPVDFTFHEDFGSNIRSVSFPTANIPLQAPNAHGSWVTGILAAKGGNNLGITGVIPNAALFVHNVAIDGTPDQEQIRRRIAQVQKAGTLSGATQVINYSMSTSCEWDPANSGSWDICADIRNSWSDIVASSPNVLIVTSAGNGPPGQPGRPVTDVKSGVFYSTYPNALGLQYDNLIVVANFGLQAGGVGYGLARSSNYGAAVSIAAPGSDIVSLYGANQYLYRADGGTSAAAPFVTGVAGLMLSVNAALKPAELKHLLEKGAKESDRYVTAPDYSTIYVLNAYRSVLLAKEQVGGGGEVVLNPGDVVEAEFRFTEPFASGFGEPILLHVGIFSVFRGTHTVEVFDGNLSLGKRTDSRPSATLFSHFTDEGSTFPFTHGEDRTPIMFGTIRDRSIAGKVRITILEGQVEFDPSHTGPNHADLRALYVLALGCKTNPYGCGAIGDADIRNIQIKKAAPINGQCGPVATDGVCSRSLTATSSGLCSAGEVFLFGAVSGGWTWSCTGTNGGAAATCSETRCLIPQ